MSAVTVSVPVAEASRARLALDLLHLLAAGAACALPLPAALIVLIGTGASAWTMRSKLLLTRHGASGTLSLHTDGVLSLAGDRSEAIRCDVAAWRILAEGAVVVAVRDAGSGRSRSLVLLVGDQPLATLREVRVWLRWRQPGVIHPDVDAVRLRDHADRFMIRVKKYLRSLNLIGGARSHPVDPAIRVETPRDAPSISSPVVRVAPASLTPAAPARGEGGPR